MHLLQNITYCLVFANVNCRLCLPIRSATKNYVGVRLSGLDLSSLQIEGNFSTATMMFAINPSFFLAITNTNLNLFPKHSPLSLLE